MAMVARLSQWNSMLLALSRMDLDTLFLDLTWCYCYCGCRRIVHDIGHHMEAHNREDDTEGLGSGIAVNKIYSRPRVLEMVGALGRMNVIVSSGSWQVGMMG